MNIFYSFFVDILTNRFLINAGHCRMSDMRPMSKAEVFIKAQLKPVKRIIGRKLLNISKCNIFHH